MEPTTPHRPTTFFQTCLGVFQGGGCRAAAFAGAYEDAVEHGVHFAEVAGASAGSIAAALIGAGASPAYFTERISQLKFNEFMVSPDPPPESAGGLKNWTIDKAIKILRQTRLKQLSYFYSHLGMYSSSQIEKWVEQELKKLLPRVGNRPVRFSDLLIPTWVIATDLKTGEVVTWSSSTTPEAEVAQAVRASCSIPVFFQPVLTRYVDGGMLSNLPTFVFFRPDARPLASRILAFALKAEGEEPDLSTAGGVGKAMMNAIVDGSQELQSKIQRGVHIISIPTGDIKATDFDRMNDDTIGYLLQQGRDATHEFFKDELGRVKTDTPPGAVCRDNDEKYSAIAENLEGNIHDIIIVEKNTDWVYSLFPSLLIWRMSGVRIRVLLTPTEEYMNHGAYRRRLLRALGVEVNEVSSVPERAYLFDSNIAERASAIMGLPSSMSPGRLVGIRYNSFYDFALIDAFRKQIESLWTAGTGGHTPQIKLERVDRQVLIDALRKGVRQYDSPNVDISVESIPIDNLIFLTHYIKEFKYRQIRHLMALYRKDKENTVDWFEPAVVNFGQGQRSLVVPPIVEASGNQYVLIQGETRAVFCRDNGITHMQGVVVSGVKEALPSNERIPIKGVRITGREFLPQERFGDSFNRGLLRAIELAAHPLDSLT